MEYDPDQPPAAADWLALGEPGRLDVVEDFHRRADIALANERAHAILHVLVETQLALGEEAVVYALRRLQRGGLNRHESLHAVGTVLAGLLAAVAKNDNERTPALSGEQYAAVLRKLTADNWRKRQGIAATPRRGP